MSQHYIGYHFIVSPLQPTTDILIAALGEYGFESFVENENGFSAYIPQSAWFDDILNDIDILQNADFDIKFEKEEIEPANWNETWESNFNPIAIDNQVYIRAPFHEKSNLAIDLVIEPKMSFGTGHHETTHLMVQLLLGLDLHNKSVLDMGCGTAVLAILSEKLGASYIDAVDIDEWSFENSIENAERNNCSNIHVYLGDASLLVHQKYDVVIANINRNILLQDMSAYSKVLQPDGILLLSGFYTEDVVDIEQKANLLGLETQYKSVRNNWVGLKLIKKS